MTPRQKLVLSILAGASVVVGALTLSLDGAQAQDRATVDSASKALNDLKVTATGKDKRAELDEACGQALKAFDDAKTTHFADGTPTTGQLKVLGVTVDVACNAVQDYRDTIEEATASKAALEQAYLCRHLGRDCPDGGT